MKVLEHLAPARDNAGLEKNTYIYGKAKNMKKLFMINTLMFCALAAHSQCKFVDLPTLQKIALTPIHERFELLESLGYTLQGAQTDNISVNAIYSACDVTYKDGFKAPEQIITIQSDNAVTYQIRNKENFMALRALLFKTKKFEGRKQDGNDIFTDDTFTYMLRASIAVWGIERNHPIYTVGIYKRKP